NKPIFVDFYAVWCGPCKAMAAEVFPQKEVGDFYNANFINYKLDMEKGEGPALAEKFGITAYPTYVFLGPRGELVHKSMGMKPAAPFIQDGMDALDPSKRLYSQIARFEKGERDTAFLYNLIVATDGIAPDTQKEAVKAYWSAVPFQNVTDGHIWEVFSDYEMDITSPIYRYVSDNLPSLAGQTDSENLYSTYYIKAIGAMYQASESGDAKLFAKANEILGMMGDDNYLVRHAERGRVYYYLKSGRWDLYSLSANKYARNMVWYDWQALNEIAWEAYEEVEDQEILALALEWAVRSVELDANYANMDTYAALLYRTGKFREAEKAAKKAIKLGKKEDADYSTTEILLEMIKGAQAK
ncbi:MAG: thioredoxin domain-containing protein, partial [Bacteroidota bacterium]|nr:thioredoxin domain-containing protein [Bacteroidota bacterium]